MRHCCDPPEREYVEGSDAELRNIQLSSAAIVTGRLVWVYSCCEIAWSEIRQRLSTTAKKAVHQADI
jgi:hypothetical protein